MSSYLYVYLNPEQARFLDQVLDFFWEEEERHYEECEEAERENHVFLAMQALRKALLTDDEEELSFDE